MSEYKSKYKGQQIDNILGNAAQKSDLYKYATKAEVESLINNALGNIPTPDVSGQISEHNRDAGAHPYIQNKVAEIEGKIPTKTSELNNDSGFLTEHQDISHLSTKEELQEKQDIISDLEDIREGAALGATALQEEQYKGTITSVELGEEVDEPELDYVTIRGRGSSPLRKVLPSYGILKIKTAEADTLDTWPVDKETKHYCTYEYKDQFNEFSGYAVVKYQGSFSLNYAKKGYRVDFYTDKDYTKKKQIKFGGLIETNSYNLKGYYTDITICRDPLINRLYKQAKETRPYSKMYPWNNKTPIFSCATGACDGFPCVLYINEEFIGLQHLMLKKEAANFNLFEASDGLLYCCDSTTWEREGNNKDEYGEWDSEFKENDGTKAEQFFLNFFDYINSDNFTKESASEYLNIPEWIDYIIFVEAFWLWDNLVRNIIVYTNDFVKVTPFLYDLDNSFGYGPKAGAIDESPLHVIGNVGWMNKFTSIFYKEFNARFEELYNKGVLSYENIELSLIEMQKGIPYSYLKQDLIKYTRGTDDYLDTNHLLDWYAKRLDYLKKRFSSQPKEYVMFVDSEIEKVLAKNIGDGVGVTKQEIELVTNFGTWFKGNTAITSFDEFESFTNTAVIEAGAFQDCINLESIVFPDNIREIRGAAFGGCDALVVKDLSLPNVVDIYDNTFVRVKVEKVSNLGAVTKIGINSFGDCKELKEVVLPSSVKKLSDRAFSSCTALRTINIDSNISSIGNSAFYDCQSLYIEDLSLPNLTTLGTYAFAVCKIQKITNLGLITSIPERAFFKNIELKTIDISERVTSLGSYAFMDCKAVEYFIFRSSTPPMLGGWAIDDTISTPIYVPDAFVDSYKTADGWGSYASRIKPLSEYAG